MIGEDGLVFPEKDAQALAHCITRLAKDEELRRDLAQRGRQRAVGRFSLNTQARMMLDLYQDVLRSAGRAVSEAHSWRSAKDR
jgi:glycosyltransferase involved in cell wall biosynthesis